MKVFFSYSIAGKSLYHKYYDTITQYIQEKKYINTNTDIEKVNPKLFYNQLKESSYKTRADIYDNLLAKISKSDICLFESSSHSLSTGFLIQKSLEHNKPVIALFLKDHLPHFLSTIQEEKFQLVQHDGTNLEKQLDDSIEKARSLADKRFNFFINPSMLNYLNQAAKKEGITKSTFIRNLILDYKRKIKTDI